LSFSINKSYNITTLAPTLLGGEYKNIKVKAILSASEAVQYRDIYTLHQSVTNIVDSLPQKVSDCSYVLFELSDENKTSLLLANEYIDPYTIVEVNTVNIGIKIYDNNSKNIALIRSTLKEVGITNMEIYTF